MALKHDDIMNQECLIFGELMSHQKTERHNIS